MSFKEYPYKPQVIKDFSALEEQVNKSITDFDKGYDEYKEGNYLPITASEEYKRGFILAKHIKGVKL